MLLVKPPAKADLVAALEGLCNGSLSREAVVSWYQGIRTRFGDVSIPVEDGYWYFESLSVLDIPVDLGDGEPYFIRQRDVEEYLLDLQHVPCGKSFEDVCRVRSHETDPGQVRWPLLMFEHTNQHRLDDVGLHPVRGIFDVHRDLVEHVHLRFLRELYLIVRQYDDQAHQLMVLGTSRDPAKLRELLETLGLH